MNWAISVVNPHLRPDYLTDLAATVELLGAARSVVLRQGIALADDSATLSDVQLRGRLTAVVAASLTTRERGRCPVRLRGVR